MQKSKQQGVRAQGHTVPDSGDAAQGERHPRSAENILKDRMAVIQDIAEANTEQLRLSQRANGMMVLDMKDDRDGVSDPDHAAAQARVADALEDNLKTINRLEQALFTLDKELAAAVRKDS